MQLSPDQSPPGKPQVMSGPQVSTQALNTATVSQQPMRPLDPSEPAMTTKKSALRRAEILSILYKYAAHMPPGKSDVLMAKLAEANRNRKAAHVNSLLAVFLAKDAACGAKKKSKRMRFKKGMLIDVVKAAADKKATARALALFLKSQL